MRVLLAKADRDLARSPNLPLGYLAASLESRGHVVTVADAASREWTIDRLIDVAGSGDFDVVGLQAYSCGWDSARRVARSVRARSAHTRVVAGGRHPSALPEESLASEPAVDFVLTSECDRSLPDLLARIDDDPSGLDGIPGLVRRSTDGIRQGPPPEAPDLDSLPLPAWHHIAPSRYPSSPLGSVAMAFPVAPIITSRGCPYSCRFCAAGGGRSPPVRFRAAEGVVDEISLLVREHGVREIQILDDNFTARRSHAVALCETLLRRGPRVALSFPNGLRLDCLEADLLRLLEDAGCHSLAVGIESGSERILRLMDKRESLGEMEERVRLIKRVTRMRVTGNFILGLPGETMDDINRTIAFARRIPIDRAFFTLYLPLPGSPLFDELRAAGRLAGLRYRDLRPGTRAAPYLPDGIAPGGLRRALWRAYVSFYARPAILASMLREVRSPAHATYLTEKLFMCLIGRESTS